jgi:hypothetical protein
MERAIIQVVGTLIAVVGAAAFVFTLFSRDRKASAPDKSDEGTRFGALGFSFQSPSEAVAVLAFGVFLVAAPLLADVAKDIGGNSEQEGDSSPTAVVGRPADPSPTATGNPAVTATPPVVSTARTAPIPDDEAGSIDVSRSGPNPVFVGQRVEYDIVFGVRSLVAPESTASVLVRFDDAVLDYRQATYRGFDLTECGTNAVGVLCQFQIANVKDFRFALHFDSIRASQAVMPIAVLNVDPDGPGAAPPLELAASEATDLLVISQEPVPSATPQPTGTPGPSSTPGTDPTPTPTVIALPSIVGVDTGLVSRTLSDHPGAPSGTREVLRFFVRAEYLVEPVENPLGTVLYRFDDTSLLFLGVTGGRSSASCLLQPIGVVCEVLQSGASVDVTFELAFEVLSRVSPTEVAAELTVDLRDGSFPIPAGPVVVQVPLS